MAGTEDLKQSESAVLSFLNRAEVFTEEQKKERVFIRGFRELFAERALPVLDEPNQREWDKTRANARVIVPVRFSVQESYSREDVEQAIIKPEYERDSSRTPWCFQQVDSLSQVLEHTSDQLAINIGTITDDAFRASKQIQVTSQEAAALAVLSSYSCKTQFLQGGFTGVWKFLSTLWIGFFTKKMELSLTEGVGDLISLQRLPRRNTVIKTKSGELFLRNEFTFVRNLDGALINFIDGFCTRRITMQPGGGFSYEVIQFEVYIQRDFLNALLEDAHRILGGLTEWTDEAIVAFVPLLQDPKFATAFGQKLEDMPLSEHQAELLADCYRRCFGRERLVFKFPFWDWASHRNTVLLSSSVGLLEGIVLLLLWFAFGSNVFTWPLFATAGGFVLLGLMSGWWLDRQYVQEQLSAHLNELISGISAITSMKSFGELPIISSAFNHSRVTSAASSRRSSRESIASTLSSERSSVVSLEG